MTGSEKNPRLTKDEYFDPWVFFLLWTELWDEERTTKEWKNGTGKYCCSSSVLFPSPPIGRRRRRTEGRIHWYFNVMVVIKITRTEKKALLCMWTAFERGNLNQFAALNSIATQFKIINKTPFWPFAHGRRRRPHKGRPIGLLGGSYRIYLCAITTWFRIPNRSVDPFDWQYNQEKLLWDPKSNICIN